MGGLVENLPPEGKIW